MGNIVPLDAAKKQQIEDIAQDFLATFGAEFLVAYGAEFAKMKLKQIDEETYGGQETKKELRYREKLKLTEPHKLGYLTKKGAIVRNWKRRYFVVNPDYTVNYYESEEIYEKGGKPKGVIHLAGYRIEENADSAEVERLKALRKTLGLSEEEIPLPDKFPEHTLELMHERRRSYYITAADEENKNDWIEMFKTCCKMTSGFKNEDPVAQAAFKTAYYRACRKACWYIRYGDCGGTEEQVLSETIVEIINYRVLSSTYSSLSGTFTIRRKIREQVMKALDSLVLAMVIPSYKGVVESAQALKEPLEKIVDEKKTEIVDLQKKITDQLSDKMESIVTKAVEEAMEDIKKMFGDLKEVATRAWEEMRKECIVGLIDKLIKDTKESKDIEDTMKRHYRIFDRVATSLTSWTPWYKIYKIEQENIATVSKYKETFDQTGGYESVYLSHDMLCEVADAAFYTFEEIFSERKEATSLDMNDTVKTVEQMESIKNDLLLKYDRDSTLTPENIAFQIAKRVVVEYVATKIEPLTKDIRKNVGEMIPDALSKVVSIEDRYDLYVEECCKSLIRKAIGIATPKQDTNETSEERIEEPKEGDEPSERNETEIKSDEKCTTEEKVENEDENKTMETSDENGGTETQSKGNESKENEQQEEHVRDKKGDDETKEENGETKEMENVELNGEREENGVKGGTEEGGTEDGGTEEGGTADGGTEEGGTEDGGTEEGGAEDGGTEEGGTEEGGTEEGGTEDGGTEEGGTEDGGTEEGGTEEGGTKDGGTEDGGTQEIIENKNNNENDEKPETKEESENTVM